MSISFHLLKSNSIMKMTKNSIFKNITIILILLVNVCQAYSQSPVEMFNQGLEMTNQAVAKDDMYSYVEGLKIMEKAQKKDKKRADWCYEIGSRYYYYVSFGGHFFAWDKDKGIKWFKEGAKFGDLRSALVLYKEYKPESEPYSIMAPKSEWKQYFKERDKSWGYAGIALQATIPSDFSDYVTLRDAAWFTNNDNLAHQYFAKAADNSEYGAIDYVIRDERALEYLTSPKAMYEAGIQMWKRGKDHDIYGHNDRENGLRMFEKSAKLNYPDAQKQMGYIYLTGQTVEPDTLKAISWYKLAAKQNLADVKYLLGKLYLNGKGIEKDGDMAFEYFKESSDSGYIHSALPLGYCYLYGIGTAQDTQQARTIFKKYFENFNHAPDQRVIFADNRVIDLDYLIGLTYYYENSSECIPFFENSLKSKSFIHVQRSDILVKLASCFQDGLCEQLIDIDKAKNLLNTSLQYGGEELNSQNIRL